MPEIPAGYSKDEIRRLVSRVVDGVVASDASPSNDPPTPHDVDEALEGAATTSVGHTVVAIGADHGGYALKEKLAFKLRESGVDVLDCGTDGPDAVDYPD